MLTASVWPKELGRRRWVALPAVFIRTESVCRNVWNVAHGEPASLSAVLTSLLMLSTLATRPFRRQEDVGVPDRLNLRVVVPRHVGALGTPLPEHRHNCRPQ